jgi:AcrR family transcriptional regulator
MTLSIPIKDDVIQQQILEAARRLFHVFGLQKVTMDDVAKAVGKGRSYIYYYYKSRDEIFDAVVNIDIHEMLAVITANVKKAKTVEEQIYAFFISKLEILRGRQSFYNKLDMGMYADSISRLNKSKVIHHKLIMKLEGELLHNILTGGIKRGELKPISKKEKEMLIFVLLSSLHGLKREVAMENKFDDIKPIVQTLSRMVMFGLQL